MTKLSNQNIYFLYYNKLKLINFNLNKNFFCLNFYSNNYHVWFKSNPKLLFNVKQITHSDKVFNLGFFSNLCDVWTNFYLYRKVSIGTKSNYNYFFKSLQQHHLVFCYMNFSKKFLFNTYFFLHFFRNFFKHPIKGFALPSVLKFLKSKRIYEISFRYSSTSDLLLLNSSHV